ncbi:MAG: DUF975 family protein [Clostridia bacterium]|nr:DUF975 family protein [Clostridia bacterium]
MPGRQRSSCRYLEDPPVRISTGFVRYRRSVRRIQAVRQIRRDNGALYGVCLARDALLFIPGIIVSLGLFEVPYLLADDPSLSGMEAIRRSWEDMKGHKGELFGLILSFIGWWLLTILTCGILAVFYTGPYMGLSEAGFYHELHHNITAETFTEESFTA